MQGKIGYLCFLTNVNTWCKDAFRNFREGVLHFFLKLKFIFDFIMFINIHIKYIWYPMLESGEIVTNKYSGDSVRNVVMDC